MQILKKEMKLKGLTLQELAGKVGVTIGSVSGWINGDNEPRAKHVKKMKNLGFSDAACLTPSKEVEI